MPFDDQSKWGRRESRIESLRFSTNFEPPGPFPDAGWGVRGTVQSTSGSTAFHFKTCHWMRVWSVCPEAHTRTTQRYRSGRTITVGVQVQHGLTLRENWSKYVGHIAPNLSGRFSPKVLVL